MKTSLFILKFNFEATERPLKPLFIGLMKNPNRDSLIAIHIQGYLNLK